MTPDERKEHDRIREWLVNSITVRGPMRSPALVALGRECGLTERQVWDAIMREGDVELDGRLYLDNDMAWQLKTLREVKP